ncbi:MAG: SDR family oxidoreductase [Nocardioides sp.]
MKVAIVGGTGKTGRAVGSALASLRVDSSAVGRRDWPRLESMLVGHDVVHVIAPNLHPDEPGYVAEVLAASANAGVRRVVYHSVVAPYAPAMPHHLGKAAAEDLVRRSGLDWTILQPCAYLDNLVPQVAAGQIEVPYSPRALFGFVTLSDVAAASAVVLSSPGHVGATVELGGPDLRCVAEVAGAFGVPVRRISVEEWRSGVAGRLSAREKNWLESMFGYYDHFGLPAGGDGLAALLGRPGTSVGEAAALHLGS